MLGAIKLIFSDESEKQVGQHENVQNDRFGVQITCEDKEKKTNCSDNINGGQEFEM
jgi:hypothetical protein